MPLTVRSRAWANSVVCPLQSTRPWSGSSKRARPASQREPLSRHVSNRCTEKEKTLDQDRDPAETREWLDALDSVETFEGIGRVDESGSFKLRGARVRSCRLPPTPRMSTP